MPTKTHANLALASSRDMSASLYYAALHAPLAMNGVFCIGVYIMYIMCLSIPRSDRAAVLKKIFKVVFSV